MTKFRRCLMISLALLLTSGCALLQKKVPVSNYCDLHQIEYYSAETKTWLLANDKLFLRDVVANNTKHVEFCGQ